MANLLAARLNELGRTSQALAPTEGVYAYTFASPAVSRPSTAEVAECPPPDWPWRALPP